MTRRVLPTNPQQRVEDAILFRFHAGESVASIARDYECSARGVWDAIAAAAKRRATA